MMRMTQVIMAIRGGGGKAGQSEEESGPSGGGGMARAGPSLYTERQSEPLRGPPGAV